MLLDQYHMLPDKDNYKIHCNINDLLITNNIKNLLITNHQIIITILQDINIIHRAQYKHKDY
jgi:hypothetical protein